MWEHLGGALNQNTLSPSAGRLRNVSSILSLGNAGIHSLVVMYQTLNALPDGFLDVSATSLHEVLSGPTLIHLPGHRPEPLFVSVLLHGNEDVGLKAVQLLLREHADLELPRALTIFVGNIAAARSGVRRLPHQPDYNRVWPGSETSGTPEHSLMAAVVAEMTRRHVFASIDLHNNTGSNPHYACVCDTSNQHLQLAALFSRTIVYFTRPRGVQTMAFLPHCPAITCECGKVGDESGARHAAELLRACLHTAEIPDRPLPAGDVHLFHTVATVKVPPDVSIGFSEEDGDIVFAGDLDRWNFNELGPGAELAVCRPHSAARLLVLDEQGRDRSADYLSASGNSLRLKRTVLPSMLTLDERIIRQDCLCYFMERYPAEA